jgi:hypothetical protein
MRHYFKSGQNMRILNPGDFFISRTGENHTYEEVIPMSKADRERIGVYEFESINELIGGGHDYTQEMLLNQINDIKDMKILETFSFNSELYTCSSRDLSTLNILLSLAQDETSGLVSNVNNPELINNQIPFFWYTRDGNMRSMDIPTLKDFTKKMYLHIMSNTLAALVLKTKILANETVDIQDDDNWPDVSFETTPEMNYEKFYTRFISINNG